MEQGVLFGSFLCFFLFCERPILPHIRRDMIDFYHIPLYAIRTIKEGADWELPDGTVIPNERLVRPADPPRRYAYCSDTAYLPSLVRYVEGVDLLFHEATFAQTEAARAKETMHSTASQAAQIAKDAEVKRLVIGHYSARYEDESILLEEALAVFPNTTLAQENLKIEL